MHVINNEIPNEPPANKAPRAERDAYSKHLNDSMDVTCLMLTTMNSKLHKQFEEMEAFDMMVHLKEMLLEQERQERFATTKALNACKMTPGTLVSAHVLKMKGLINQLDKLGAPISHELATDLILGSLLESYDQFVMNYNMHHMEKSIAELHGMLKNVETKIQKTNPVLMVQKGEGVKRKRKGKGNKAKKGKGQSKLKAKKPKPPKKGVCFFCNEQGHWKRCKLFLEDLKKKKSSEATTLGIYVIEVNLSTSTSWVLDIGCGSPICVNVQGLRGSRSLVKGEVDLRVGNEARVVALAVGVYDLTLPSGLVFQLKNCYYVPTVSRNIISISCLDVDGFHFIIKNNIFSIYNADIFFYENAHLSNGLYVLNLEQPKPIYNIDTKRFKSNNLDPTYFWHCCLGHINEKRILKLYQDGLRHSFDLESFQTCESCLLGKMTKAPFAGHGERASDLLGLIHTDVCGPISSIARGGY